jgi:hypothetical protein
MSKSLSRLDITGEINLNTPKIVLEEIAHANSIKFDIQNDSVTYLSRIIIKLSKSSIKDVISEDFENDSNSLRVIAKYVNSHCKNWRKKTLLSAFNFLQNFISEENINSFSKSPKRFNIKYGLQTPEETESLNACILYRLCKYHSISTNINTTCEEMINNLKLYYYISENSKIKNDAQMYIFDMLRFQYSANDIVNILSLETTKFLISDEIEMHEYEDATKLGYEEFSKCAFTILDETEEEKCPKNACEAIVLAALQYKIDITECEDPLKEYSFLEKEPYFPQDSKLKERLRISYIYPESLESPWLDKNFNPNLPEKMYEGKDLINLCVQEGIDIFFEDNYFDEDYYTNEDKYYSSLQTVYLIETFIHGKQGNISNKETTFLEKIEDLEYDEVVVYGVRGDIRNDNYEMRAYTYGELCDTFSNYKRFSDPITKELFNEDVIEKLYLLTQKERRETESEKIYKERNELGDEIERVKIYNSNKNQYVEEFLEIYESLSEYDKDEVENFLTLFLHLGMYMRGWDGKEDYPLKSKETNFETEKQIVVDDRVTQCLIKIEKKSKELGELGIFIINLPLMEYIKESNAFSPSYDEIEGLTIKDRMEIVRGGENGTLNSCIRTSSNKFCATGYYYMILIGFRLPFNINEMSHIF